MAKMMKNKDGEPMVCIMTQDEMHILRITTGYEIHRCNEFLRGLGFEAEFEDYRQYGELLGRINAEMEGVA